MAEKIDYQKELDKIHLAIHAVRLIQNYKASELDRKVSSIILKAYSPTCEECSLVLNKINNTPPPKGFFGKLGDAAEAWKNKK